MEFGLTEFIAKILLYTEKKQMSFGTIRKTRCSRINNLCRDSIKMDMVCSVR